MAPTWDMYGSMPWINPAVWIRLGCKLHPTRCIRSPSSARRFRHIDEHGTLNIIMPSIEERTLLLPAAPLREHRSPFLEIPTELRLRIFQYLCLSRALHYYAQPPQKPLYISPDTMKHGWHAVLDLPASSAVALRYTCRKLKKELRRPYYAELQNPIYLIHAQSVYFAFDMADDPIAQKALPPLEEGRIEELVIHVRKQELVQFLRFLHNDRQTKQIRG